MLVWFSAEVKVLHNVFVWWGIQYKGKNIFCFKKHVEYATKASIVETLACMSRCFNLLMNNGTSIETK